MTSARWTNGILAVWLALSALLGLSVVGNVINLVTVGTIVAGAGAALVPDSKWQGVTATLAGSWLIVAPLAAFLRSGQGLLWNSVIIGTVILLASVPLSSRRSMSGKVATSAPGPARVRSEETAGEPSGNTWKDPVGTGDRELAHH